MVMMLSSIYDPAKILSSYLPYSRQAVNVKDTVIIPREKVRQFTASSDGGVITIITIDGITIDFYDYSWSTGTKMMVISDGDKKIEVKLNNSVTVSLFEKELWVIF